MFSDQQPENATLITVLIGTTGMRKQQNKTKTKPDCFGLKERNNNSVVIGYPGPINWRVPAGLKVKESRPAWYSDQRVHI